MRILARRTPRPAIVATTAGSSSWPGSDPPDHATARLPARCWKNPSTIWLRPALCTHRNSTVGLPSWACPSTRARAVNRWRANRSAGNGRKSGTVLYAANWS
ncbi:hypothetical protein GCM10018963_54150 [Saccharothrix longispora]